MSRNRSLRGQVFLGDEAETGKKRGNLGGGKWKRILEGRKGFLGSDSRSTLGNITGKLG
jgi:hypothetical protein